MSCAKSSAWWTSWISERRPCCGSRFGLEGEEPKTLKQIGEHLGLTRERVRQIERQALAKLQERLLAG